MPQKFMTEFWYFFLESEYLGGNKCHTAKLRVSVTPPYIYFYVSDLCCVIVFSQHKTSLGYAFY